MSMGTILGITIAVLNVLILVGVVVWRAVSWKLSRPKQLIRGVGVRYLKGASPGWQGMECVIDQLYIHLGAARGLKLTDEFLSRVIIEVVAADATRRTPTTIVSKATRIAGSVDTERQWPWSERSLVAVVLQDERYETVSKSAAAHEIIKHLLPYHLGEGWNADHSRADLNALSQAVERACP